MDLRTINKGAYIHYLSLNPGVPIVVYIDPQDVYTDDDDTQYICPYVQFDIANPQRGVTLTKRAYNLYVKDVLRLQRVPRYDILFLDYLNK